MTYDEWVAQISNLAVIKSSDPNFVTMLPGCRDYAENRMYQELDLLATRVTTRTTSLSTTSRTVTLSTTAGDYIVVEEFSTVTQDSIRPARNVSKQFIDAVYPSASTVNGVPQYFAMVSNTEVMVGPTPDIPYVAEVIGTIRPTPLSSANQTTILTTLLPAAFVAASMVFVSGYMRDFGAQSDNPQQAQSWENQYKTLMASAGVEELRKKYQSQAWTSEIPNPVATPQRV